MALNSTQELELGSLVSKKLVLIENDPDKSKPALLWFRNFIKLLSDENQEAVYDELLAEMIAEQEQRRIEAVAHFDDVIGVLTDKQRV